MTICIGRYLITKKGCPTEDNKARFFCVSLICLPLLNFVVSNLGNWTAYSTFVSIFKGCTSANCCGPTAKQLGHLQHPNNGGIVEGDGQVVVVGVGGGCAEFTEGGSHSIDQRITRWNSAWLYDQNYKGLWNNPELFWHEKYDVNFTPRCIHVWFMEGAKISPLFNPIVLKKCNGTLHDKKFFWIKGDWESQSCLVLRLGRPNSIEYHPEGWPVCGSCETPEEVSGRQRCICSPGDPKFFHELI